MGTFIYFTEEQKRQANKVDLAEFLRRQGEKLLPSGRDYRLDSDHSVTIRGSEWFDHETQTGGHAIDFVRTHYGMTFPEADRVQERLGDAKSLAVSPFLNGCVHDNTSSPRSIYKV